MRARTAARCGKQQETCVIDLKRFRTALSLTAVIVLLAGATPAAAQRIGRAGDFDYYALVLSWSPTYCADVGQGRNDPQCNSVRPYAFVLHGLWPQYARGYPESCPVGNSFVPRPIIDGMLDIMPSPRLVIHEYRKHGTCSGLDPRGYFDTARRLYDRIKIPSRYQSPDRQLVTSPAEIVKDFLAANPEMKADMLAVACGRPNRVREIRFCFSREGQLRSCGRNEEQDRLCRASSVVLPPVRGPRPFNPRFERRI
ncbi:MAG: ribonuclease T [Hyphomicrobiaceae bacterium]|nr:MAG: ribonuclease T [Hyphomicrobiaceae bacterium]